MKNHSSHEDTRYEFLVLHYCSAMWQRGLFWLAVWWSIVSRYAQFSVVSDKNRIALSFCGHDIYQSVSYNANIFPFSSSIKFCYREIDNLHWTLWVISVWNPQNKYIIKKM